MFQSITTIVSQILSPAAAPTHPSMSTEVPLKSTRTAELVPKTENKQTTKITFTILFETIFIFYLLPFKKINSLTPCIARVPDNKKAVVPAKGTTASKAQ